MGDNLHGRFELLGEIGAGGMGTVHRARDLETGEIVAVKLLSPRARAEADRFVREAELLAELRAPSIVRYVLHGVSQDGRAFLAMEWLDGEDLSRRLARGPLSADDAALLAERVAAALAVAHARGVVHRDIKPSNVFLVGGAPREARVLDFGVALVARVADRTKTGIVVGTPGYMAPEQARGERGVDARADVFALGCVLYECLTGAPAFVGDNLLALLGRILLEDPRPPRELCALPPELDALVMRMLSKDRAARPADGAAVLDALSRVPASVAAPASRAAALGADEQEWLSLVFARDAALVDTASADTLASGDLDGAQRVAAAVAPLGARVERLLDGTALLRLAAGGSPRDRALRAVRAALAIRDALGPAARVVIATGRGVRGARAPIGQIVDRAGALLAAPVSADGPRVDAWTAELLDTRHALGGDAHGLVLTGELSADEAPRRLLGRPTACVGRDREIATLLGLFDECVSEGLARAVLVTAPPGAGKSRLRHELSARLAERGGGCSTWIARADVIGAGSTRGMLTSLVRSALALARGETGDDDRALLLERVGRHVAPSDVERVAAFLGELLQTPFSDERVPALRGARRDVVAMGDQISAAWDDFLAAEVRAGPRVLVLEDLHWGDAATVRAIDRALRRLKDAPLFVLATARPEVHETFPALWAGRDVQEVRLVPLTPRASERLVRGALGDTASPALVERIVTRAEGNAFLLEELVRAAASDPDGQLPETALSLIAARLDALDGASRRVLRAASVFGEVFWRGGVAELTQDPELDRTLARVVEAEVVEPRGTSRFDGERELCFRHALLRDAAYAALTPDDLTVGHRLAARWLEGAGETDDVALAEHHERGAELAAASQCWARAAERALEGNDFEAAIHHAGRALERGATDEAACFRLIADAEQWRGNYQSSLDAALAAAARYAPGSVGWHRSVMLQAVCLQRLGRSRELPALAALVLAAGPTPGAEATRIEVLVRLATRLHFFEQRGATSAELLAGAAAIPHDPGDLATQGWLGAADALRAHVRGDLPTYVEHIGRAGELLCAAGNVRDSLSQLEDQGWWLAHCGDFERAARVTTHVIAEAERLGLRRVETNARTALVWQHICLGRSSEAVALATPLARAAGGGAGDRLQAEMFLAWAHLSGGGATEARAVLEPLLRDVPRGGALWRASAGMLAEALQLEGRGADAARVADDLADALRSGHSGPHFDMEAACSAAVVAMAGGDLDEARTRVSWALELSDACLSGFTDPLASARVLERVRHHARARSIARQLGLRP